MFRQVFLKISLLTLCATAPFYAADATAPDKLGRDNPQSSVIAFLQSCRRQDYDTASQYLDLRSPRGKAAGKINGPETARKLEAALNSAADFNALAVTQDPEGTADASQNPPREQVATLRQNATTYKLDLELVTRQPGGPPVWLFSRDTVAAVQVLSLSTAASWMARHLPPFMTSVELLETSLWVWLALLLAAGILLSLGRHLDRLLLPVFRAGGQRLALQAHWEWSEALLSPIRVILSIAVFRLAVELVRPSALARLYIGRALELILTCSIAWCLVRIVDLLLNRVESRLATRREFSGRSILRLGRRTISITIIVIAALMLLSSWGYNTGTLVAGLGVGGIAVALAAQQTIANVFGGISIIGDRPVGIGDFGKFGDLLGTVEDIGMRSTQVRTLNRTVVSVPNSTFAGANLENYSVRDKILFNPTFQVKRSTPDDEVWRLIEALRKALGGHRAVELVPTPVRLIGLTAAAFNIEIFCYVLTPDIDEFYEIQGELLLAVNDALLTAHLELV